MLPQIKIVLPALAAVAVVGLVAGAPLSLMSDVGYTDEFVCSTVLSDGPTAVARLKATGFPQATGTGVDTYRLTRDGVVEAALLINWNEGTAECLNLDTPTSDVTIDLTPKAYDTLVYELRSVIEGGHITGNSVSRGFVILMGSEVSVDKSTVPVKAGAFKWDLAKWSFNLAGGE